MFRRSVDKQLTECFIKLTQAADKAARTADGTLNELREALSQARAANIALERINLNLERELSTAKANFDWLKAKTNQLEYERAALLQQLSNITVPVPNIMEKPASNLPDPTESFEDIGDDLASALHLDQFADTGDDRR